MRLSILIKLSKSYYLKKLYKFPDFLVKNNYLLFILCYFESLKSTNHTLFKTQNFITYEVFLKNKAPPNCRQPSNLLIYLIIF